jgi:hypothetical protein
MGAAWFDWVGGTSFHHDWEENVREWRKAGVPGPAPTESAPTNCLTKNLPTGDDEDNGQESVPGRPRFTV